MSNITNPIRRNVMKRFIALMLSVITVVCLLVSCGGNEETAITVTITVQNEGKEMYPKQEVTLKKTDDYIPTVYDAVCQLLEVNEAEFQTGQLGGYDIITSIDGVKETDDKFWQILINDEEPDARYAALPITDGNDIIFYFGKSLDDTDTEAPVTTTEAAPVQTADDGYVE